MTGHTGPGSATPAAAVRRDGTDSAEKIVHHFKKSPTLLFDILAEPDKEKQQQKLQRATLQPAELAAQTHAHPRHQQQQQQQQPLQLKSSPPLPVPHPRATSQQQQHHGPTQQHPDGEKQQQQLQERQSGRSSRIHGPGTPDLPPEPLGRLPTGTSSDSSTAAEAAAAYGSAAVSSVQPDTASAESSDGGVQHLDSALASGCAPGAIIGAPPGPALTADPGRPQALRQPHPQPGNGVALANGLHTEQKADIEQLPPPLGTEQETPADEGGRDADGDGVVADAAPVPPAAAAVVPAPSPSEDLLKVFTPRVILQELLGELFVPPERLHKHGTFGQGAFATVQSCSMEDPDGGPSRLVAVKSLKPEVLSDMEDLRRFLLEANLVRKLKHPNIVSIHGLGAHRLDSLESLRASAYVVMEALEGGDLRMMVLRQMTGRTAAYSRLDALRWCLHIAAGCAYLHETCRPMIIHRDLKLENVMLTGGSTDSRVAKITDFGLHKRARYSRTEDVLIAVTNEWSTRDGSVYRSGLGGGGGAHGGRPDLYRDASTYGGSVIDASYYGGNAYGDGLFSGASTHRGTAAGNSAHYAPCGGGGDGNNRSGSSRYAALAATGMAAAAAAGADGFTDAVTAGIGTAGSVGRASSVGPGDSLRAGSEAAAALGLGPDGGKATGAVKERERPYLLAYDKRYDAMPAGSKFSSTNDLVALHDTAVVLAAASAAAPAAVRSPFGGEAAQQQPWPQSPPRPKAPAGAPGSEAPAGASGNLPPPLPPPPPPQQQQPMHSEPLGAYRSGPMPPGWIPPNVVPPSMEESVHRKMLALMALESAAAAAAVTPAASAQTAGAAASSPTDGAAGGGQGQGPGQGLATSAATGAAAPAAAAAQQPFSVTEFVRAAAAVPMEGVGPGGPSAVMLMRSMSLALQQQRLEQQGSGGGAATPAAGCGSGVTGGALPSDAPAGPPVLLNSAPPSHSSTATGHPQPMPRAARTASAAMKTVPEHNRMSMDLGGASSTAAAGPSLKGGFLLSGGRRADGTAAAAGAGGGGSAPSAPGAKRMASKAARREAAAAAARMADATRQVGSLIYMAPELVLSGSYNEKVDVFSFAIIAYELFMGKLLAMKVANEHAYRQIQSSRPSPHNPQAAGPGGLGASGPLPVAGTPSAEAEAEAGVMSYVMRRSTAGVREALPSWWPSELRSLVGRCWAHDPAERPSFSQIFRELKQMQNDGTLKDMDAKDPLRSMGCGCVIC